ncbi:LysM peptidoglycan-binding domain-containing protein [Caloramator sp. CAR-1]|uniref:LysM peptidoglycan-binding domain-containing protein n=1 Tax=Caloramator sp. CAR-1 TaxID=3062777 RepID=UPI0026E22022|nr:LysM peptidoglycan-binding domain-containing protein [Caloramator sp. CAR-1]MDO6354067.1 LysM peptidoglycan-binding domain-containing protein [Caloramator sp. CAR-1]
MKKNESYQNNKNINNIRAQIPERCRMGFQRYTVVAGDTIEKIAKRFNVTVDFLIAENPHIQDPDKIFPGDVLCVPVQPKPGEPRIPESCPLGFNRYTVKVGDTVSKIAQGIGVPVDLIVVNNLHIPDPNVIFPGDVLCVPVPLKFPSCTILNPVNPAMTIVLGSAMVQKIPPNEHQLTIAGINLPSPSSLGDFDGYDGFVGIPGIGGYGFSLSRCPSQFFSLWIGSITLFPLLSVGDQIYVIPSNSKTGQTGRPILSGVLK